MFKPMRRVDVTWEDIDHAALESDLEQDGFAVDRVGQVMQARSTGGAVVIQVVGQHVIVTLGSTP